MRSCTTAPLAMSPRRGWHPQRLWDQVRQANPEALVHYPAVIGGSGGRLTSSRAWLIRSPRVVRRVELGPAGGPGHSARLFSLAAKMAEGEVETFELAEPALPVG